MLHAKGGDLQWRFHLQVELWELGVVLVDLVGAEVATIIGNHPHMSPTRRLQNIDFGSIMGPLGSGRGVKRRGAPVEAVLAKFQLEWSHGAHLRDQNHVLRD